MTMNDFTFEVTGSYDQPIQRQAAESVKLERALRARDKTKNDANPINILNSRVDFHQPGLKQTRTVGVFDDNAR